MPYARHIFTHLVRKKKYVRRLAARCLITVLVSISASGGQASAQSQAPAPVGAACTPYAQLRGSTVKPPADGDVATVAQLCLHDSSVASLDRVPFSADPATPVSDMRLLRDASVKPLTSLGTPEASAIDIRSRNGNWTHLFSGAFWRAPAITASGEIQALDRGHAQFSVAASLSYFAVVLPRFLARVKGTIFDIDFDPAQAASFSVSEGTVAVTRTTAIRLKDEKRVIDGIRFTDIITAGGRSSVTYKLPLGVEHEFQNQSEAVHALTQQLQEAIAGGDPQAVDDAVYNLQIVTGQTIVGFAPHPSNVAHALNPATAAAGHVPVAAIAGAAAIGAGIAGAAGAFSGHPAATLTPPPGPASTPSPVSGGVTLTGHAGPAASPTPAPMPAPTTSLPAPPAPHGAGPGSR